MWKGLRMTIPKLTLVLVCLMPVTLGPKEAPQEAKVTTLFSRDLPDVPGKEGLMITVEYPPGASDPVHRHNADAFVYVLEGSIVMQVRGVKEATLTPGQTFYEGPSDEKGAQTGDDTLCGAQVGSTRAAAIEDA
jgi:quercetin dioxygenase-like cupin family protein